MPAGRSILILGEGPTGRRLQNMLGVSETARLTVSDLRRSGLGKSARFRGLILCADEIADLRVALETVGDLCKRSKRFAKIPFPVVLLTAKRSQSLENQTVVGTMQCYPLRIRLLSIPSLAARRLLRRYPLHLGADGGFGQVVHILIVGFSDLGIAIAVYAMRMAHYGSGRPRLTIAARNPLRTRADFLSEFPEAQSVAEIHFIDLDSSDFKIDIPITSVYLCDAATRENAVRVDPYRESMRRHQTACPPIFLEIGDSRTSKIISDWDGQIYPFSALSDACDPSVLFGDCEDELAVIVHDYYRDSIAAQGRPLEGNPAGEPWERLDESYRQANRHQADHMAAKAAAIDCRFVPEQESEFFVFYPREVENLARIEHARWSADRYLNGWKYGPVRDNDKKIHPELIPYEDLSDDMKDLDRYTVRLMPALLGRKGLAIRRNLIIAVSSGSSGSKPGKGYIRSVDSVFTRLTERYPDRTLVFAIDLAIASQRALARRAKEKFRAGCWSLIGEPIDRLLMRAGSERYKIECLEMLACSERRICLDGRNEIIHWLSQRAEIALIVGPLDEPGRVRAGPGIPLTDADPGAAFAGLRQVRLDPDTGFTGWSFEY